MSFDTNVAADSEIAVADGFEEGSVIYADFGRSAASVIEPKVVPNVKTDKRVAGANSINHYAYYFLKRAFDILVSAFVLIIGFIPAIILSFIVRKDTGGSAIYTQERFGKGGRKFKIYKFRSMVADSDNVEKYLSPEQLAIWKVERKVDNDPRITKLGRKLRQTSIDEFPQFINVFLGHMSIVGPRPLSADEVKHFGKDQDLLLSVPAGITGLWQTGERNKATFESGLRQNIELQYVKNASLTLDMIIIGKTFKVMFNKTGK